MPIPKPVVLCILDGWGLSEQEEGNAPLQAHTPHFDRIMQGPNAQLLTHGRDVGLPVGQMGNSEVGHTNIGAGRIVPMDLVKIDDAIADADFATQPALQDFIATLKKSGGVAHLIGLVSDGGVHSQMSHLIAAVDAITKHGVPVAIHAITDGRDVAPKSAQAYIKELESRLPQTAQIATVVGRYFAMDRDTRWDRVAKAYGALVSGQGAGAATAQEAVTQAYASGETDEFITPTVLSGYAGFAPEDGIFMLNYRADRARELLEAIGKPTFDGFARGAVPVLAARLGMVDYSQAHNAWYKAVFPKTPVINTLGAWVARQGLTQFRLAETEKYPHVTFFLNGGVEDPEQGEARYMPKSPAVATYDLQPEMSAGEVTETFVKAIEDGYDLIVVNFANPDMVGHTGSLSAAIAACEAVDEGLGQVLDALESAQGAMIVTADHGNCEMMIDPETGGVHTAHTTNPVPVALVGGPQGAVLRDGRLADLAPTLLNLMGVTPPGEMTGKTLIS
jgi:2,3-bisphosphoglycerate-independent phosphoglycerate mutase